MIKPWIFEFFPELGDAAQNAPPKAIAAHFANYLDLWTRDEALGFEGIFFSEHHFGNSYGASPNLLIAAMASRTRTMRLGVMGVVLPYYHPARVVEEIGMLDHLTGGRLEIGTAIGIPQELARLGMSMAEARERNDEIVEILHAALKQRVVSHKGKYFEFTDLRMQPPAMQEPPPVWTTVVSAESARKAARRGSKISTGFNATPQIKAIFDAYREEADRAGIRVGPDHLALRRRVTLAPTNEQAQVYAEGVAARIRKYVSEDPRAKLKPVPDAPGGGGFTLSDDEFITGTPSDAAEQIVAQCRAVGAGHFLAVLNWSAPFDEVAHAHDLLGREAVPVLRKASV
ncbi:MAG: LLM class flavin-dependent oxidoreductase [Alphaproteobacteria bacterium]|nr:LLM class flavin-dependent oxidoreductase [Alphaproteobacteria bacterium]